MVGCSIFKAELEEVLRGQDQFEVETLWLLAGYHVRPELLSERLGQALSGLDAARLPEARILYGERCMAEIPEAAKGLKALPTANCLTALLGERRLRELEKGPAMVVTPAWIRSIYLSRDEEFPIWDEFELRMNLGRYERLVVLDHGLCPLSDEEVLEAFDLTGKILEPEPASLGHFRDLIMDFLR